MSAALDDARIRDDWAQRGFSCGIWVDAPGQVWADYVHDTDELIMLIEGEIEVTFQGRARRPAVGEELFIPARTRHTVINVGDRPSRWYYGYRRRS